MRELHAFLSYTTQGNIEEADVADLIAKVDYNRSGEIEMLEFCSVLDTVTEFVPRIDIKVRGCTIPMCAGFQMTDAY